MIDISGEWSSRLHEDIGYRGTGPALGDYTGLPLNDAGVEQAESWNAEQLSAPEEQSKPHPAQYAMRGPGTNLRISKIFDPFNWQLIAYSITGTYGRADRTIWLDGRPHPSANAEHLWQGFSTGRIVRNMLVVTTTHMKTGWVLRNYAPSSNKSTMTEYFIRHGDLLDLMTVIDDPVYFQEPLVRTSTWVLQPDLGVDNRMFFDSVEEEVGRAADAVPHYPLGTRHDEFAKELGLPLEAVEGGSQTLYPDYIPRLRQLLAGEKPAPINGSIPGYTPDPPSTVTADKYPPVDCAGLDVNKDMIAVDQGHGRARVKCTPAAEVEVLQVRSDLYMLVAEGVNVTVQTGKDGVLVVNTGLAAEADKVLQAIRSVSSGPIRFVINTGFHKEATAGNAALVKAGGPKSEAERYGNFASKIASGATVIAQQNVDIRLATQTPSLPPEAIPTSSFSERKSIYFNGEPIELLSAPAAASDADSIVFFRKSDVISAGDLLDTTRYPLIDSAAGGSLQGVIDGLTHIIQIAVPERNAMGGTLVIPARGWICNQIDVVQYRNMLTIIRDRVRDLAKKHLTLDQVKAAHPTIDYDGIYGASTGPWTTEMFLAEVYRELSTRPAKGPH
jgi:glyoxylase-like metal-dependent hydrolase (beta-lactamase superfamily II)